MSPKPSLDHHDPSENPLTEEESSPALVERITDTTTDIIPRPRNLGFDALVAVFGYTPEGSEASLFGRVAAKANREPDPAEAVRIRAGRLVAQWGTKALTVSSLDKWWQRFGTALGGASETDAQKFRDELERSMRRQKAAELDGEILLPDEEPDRDAYVIMSGDRDHHRHPELHTTAPEADEHEEARRLILDADAEYGEESA